MSAGMLNEQSFDKHMEKQMGCMAGFLQIFDRHQILSGKRHYSAKRLPPSPLYDTTSESEKSAPASPAISREFGKPKPLSSPLAEPSPERSKYSHSTELRSPLAAELPPKSPLQLPTLQLKEGTRCSWKFTKEAPRLSLDSRATTDAKGSLHPKEIRTVASAIADTNRCDSIVSDESQSHRSPSVIARLMGLEPLPDSSCSDPEAKPELRRSASESRVFRDLFHSRFISERKVTLVYIQFLKYCCTVFSWKSSSVSSRCFKSAAVMWKFKVEKDASLEPSSTATFKAADVVDDQSFVNISSPCQSYTALAPAPLQSTDLDTLLLAPVPAALSPVPAAPIGYRLRRHLREEKSKHSEVFLDPFTKRPTSSCHGVPLGGIG